MPGSVVVGIEEGKVRGEEVPAGPISERTYFAFRGIPYAQPAVGSLRFKDPQPVAAWEGVRDATRDAPACPQRLRGTKKISGEEGSCLALNVYTPRLAGVLMPVVVWVHGGSFTFGSGGVEECDPEYWMRRDVVVVTFNYRLGVLGFLSLGTDDVPGNAGLKDQVQVLRWVRRNVVRFTGDPGNVTLAGSSAGAACVHYHLLSTMSRGMFHRAVLMSGCSLNYWAHSEGAVRRSYRLGEVLRCSTQDPQKLLEFLRNVPVSELVKLQNSVFTDEEKRGLRQFPFVPCVEPKGGRGERFLTEHPRILLQRGQVAPVPIIMGVNDSEGMVRLTDTDHSDVYFEHLDANFSWFMPKTIECCTIAPNQVKQFYFQDKKISWETIDKYYNYFGDVIFYMGVDEVVRLHLRLGAAPVYCYRFSFEGRLGIGSWSLRRAYPRRTITGVCHIDDTGYIFKSNLPGSPQLSDLPQDAAERDVVNLMTAMLHQFALTGNPKPTGQAVRWEPASTHKQSWRGYLEVNTTLVMRNARLEKRIEFWDQMKIPSSKI